jgi:hypothetical protein
LINTFYNVFGYITLELACLSLNITTKRDINEFGVLLLELAMKHIDGYMEDDGFILCD